VYFEIQNEKIPKDYLSRTSDNATDFSYFFFKKIICDLDVSIIYTNGPNLEKQELSKIMLVDSCFLFELVITKGFDSQLPCINYSPPAAPQVLKNDDVLSDLMLFENQIPLFIVHVLSETLFPHFFGEDSSRETIFNNLVQPILGYSHIPEELKINAPHLLGVVHSFVNNNNNNNNDDEHLVEIRRFSRT